MRTIDTGIDIAADPARVWEVLTDFEAYPEWNPFVIGIDGPAAEGARLEAVLRLGDRRPATFRPTVTRWEPERAFEWFGHLGIRGVFDGRHGFELTPTDGGTRFRQVERFTGVLAGLLLRFVGEDTARGFHAMNRALKGRAEAAA